MKWYFTITADEAKFSTIYVFWTSVLPEETAEKVGVVPCVCGQVKLIVQFSGTETCVCVILGSQSPFYSGIPNCSYPWFQILSSAQF